MTTTIYTDPAAEWQDRYKELARAWHDEHKRLTAAIAAMSRKYECQTPSRGGPYCGASNVCYECLRKHGHEEEARADKAEAELAAERKRLDWVLDEMGLVELRNLLFLHWDCQEATLRAAIDAAIAANTDRSIVHEESGADT